MAVLARCLSSLPLSPFLPQPFPLPSLLGSLKPEKIRLLLPPIIQTATTFSNPIKKVVVCPLRIETSLVGSAKQQPVYW